jgi:16S rRNA (cytidine1402-2'-O)-methyltransferase
MPGRLLLFPSAIAETDTGWMVPPRVAEELQRVKHYIVENEKSARRFLKSAAPGIVQAELVIHELDKHDPDKNLPALLQPAMKGHDIGLLSEAGSPAVADPGAAVVAAAHKLGLRVVPRTGPSAILLALMASGLEGQRFCFHGYLPVEAEPRKAAIKRLEAESGKNRQTQVFIETPYRNDRLLAALLSVCSGETLLCIASGIAGEEEKIQTKAVAAWRKERLVIGKVPCVFLLMS